MRKGVLLLGLVILLLVVPTFAQPACKVSPEVCDGLDNDCDGDFDEDQVCVDSFSQLEIDIDVDSDCDLSGDLVITNLADRIPAKNVEVELLAVAGDSLVSNIVYDSLVKNIAPGKTARVPFEIITSSRYDSAPDTSIIELSASVLSLDFPASKDKKNIPNPPGNTLVEICHQPLTSQGIAVTIHVDQNAVGAHLAHGDFLGTCPDPNMGVSDTYKMNVCSKVCTATTEVCDGKDNDCDGDIDEDIRVPCGLTDAGTCSFGTRRCERGTLTACVGEIIPDIEICNGLDDDCDGEIDEGVIKFCGTDEGVCQIGEQTCSEGVWGACSGLFIGPAQESCNGLDDDCDGQIDEGGICECTTGETRACGTSAGVCESGTQTCLDGLWGSCSGERTGSLETCNGLDDDCDGEVDEDLSESFGTDIGACSLGSKQCVNGQMIALTDAVVSALEICNGLDDDCDGLVDEELYRSCGESDTGSCSFGLQVCTMGDWGSCQGAVGPVFESCNSVDDDCDGTVDNDISDIFSGTNVGSCREEQLSCSDGEFTLVQSGITAQPEICDGLDNDCNGLIDENIADRIFGTDAGYCISQIEHCVDGSFTLVQESRPARDEFCNGVDDDCDGLVDEDLSCSCSDGETRTCGSNIGSCEKGEQTCTGGEWGACQGMIDATAEICDGLDNDCNGLVDESMTDLVAGSNVGVCKPQVTSCVDGRMVQTQQKILPHVEVCDGLDNDCDGLVDEDLPYEFLGSDEGECASSVFACVDGTKQRIREEIQSGEEICDGLDNDCDGLVDENLADIIVGSSVGVCTPSVTSCVDGKMSILSNEIRPSGELCNGLDDDCDGLVDEELLNGVTGTNAGECQSTITACRDGEFTVMQQGVSAVDEICDGLDNDCDGKIDNGIDCGCVEDDTRSCGIDIGACQKGTQTCNNGLWGPCIGSIDSVSETCDGFDNDCDGEIDELLDTIVGGNAAGACQPSITQCGSGVIFTVQQSVDPVAETCNGIDDDCNGLVDDGLRFVKETKDIGLCQPEIWDCIDSTMTLIQKEVNPVTEICDGFDNDCDGQVDEVCEPTIFPLSAPAPTSAPEDGGDTTETKEETEPEKTTTSVPSPAPSAPVFTSKPSRKSKYIPAETDPFKQPLLQPRTLPAAAPTTASPAQSLGSQDNAPNFFSPITPAAAPTSNKPSIIRLSTTAPNRGISLILGELPLSLSPTDPVVRIPAVVKNTGRTALNDIVAASAPASENWNGLNVGIDVLAPGEEKAITFELRPVYCSNNLDQGDYRIPLTDIEIEFMVKETDAVSDTATVALPLQADPFALASPPKNFASDQTMKVCYFVANQEAEEKDRYEIEFELFDREDDLIIDYLSPIAVGNDEMLMKVRDYRLGSVPRQKTYELRGFLYENGTLFSSGYLVGEGRDQVDLATVPPQPTGWSAVVQRIRGVFS